MTVSLRQTKLDQVTRTRPERARRGRESQLAPSGQASVLGAGVAVAVFALTACQATLPDAAFVCNIDTDCPAMFRCDLPARRCTRDHGSGAGGSTGSANNSALAAGAGNSPAGAGPGPSQAHGSDGLSNLPANTQGTGSDDTAVPVADGGSPTPDVSAAGADGMSASASGSTPNAGHDAPSSAPSAGAGSPGCMATNSHTMRACAGGNLQWFDDCGAPTEIAQDCCGAGCADGSCKPPEQHAASVCDHNDLYWVDACGTLEELRQDCCDMGCSAGRCNPPDRHVSTACYQGNKYWFDSCNMPSELAEDCAGRGCENGSCKSSCPSDMVAVPNANVCIDKYESSLWSTPSCSGTNYTAAPAGLPELCTSQGLSGSVSYPGGPFSLRDPSTPVYACSLAGKRPASRLTYFQAKRVCENSNKRLCTWQQWLSACSTSDGYPYGNSYQAGACNLSALMDETKVVATGSFTACAGGVDGLFDMAGNATEWVLCTPDAGTCTQMGASDTGVCNSYLNALDLTLVRGGVRCCKDE